MRIVRVKVEFNDEKRKQKYPNFIYWTPLYVRYLFQKPDVRPTVVAIELTTAVKYREQRTTNNKYGIYPFLHSNVSDHLKTYNAREFT